MSKLPPQPTVPASNQATTTQATTDPAIHDAATYAHTHDATNHIVPDVTEEAIAEIVRLGLRASPEEICGLLLPSSHHPGGTCVVVLPNSAPPEVRTDTFEIAPEHLMAAVDTWIELERDMVERWTEDERLAPVVWHTHPSGLVGPSRPDLAIRAWAPGVPFLVVTLPYGQAVRF